MKATGICHGRCLFCLSGDGGNAPLSKVFLDKKLEFHSRYFSCFLLGSRCRQQRAGRMGKGQGKQGAVSVSGFRNYWSVMLRKTFNGCPPIQPSPISMGQITSKQHHLDASFYNERNCRTTVVKNHCFLRESPSFFVES